MEGTSVLHWNCRGARKNIPGILQVLKNNNTNEPTVIALQETHLKGKQTVYIEGYKGIYNNRDTSSGGVATLYQKDTKVLDHSIFSTTNLEGVKITIKTELGPLTILNIYASRGKIEDEDTDVLASYLTPNTIIVGDFNAHHPTWGSPKTDAAGDRLVTFINDNNLKCLNNGKPTYVTHWTTTQTTIQSHIDLTFASEEIEIEHWDTIPELISDHYPITCTINTREYIKINNKPKFHFDKADWSKFRALIDKIDIGKLTDTNIDQHASNTTKAILDAATNSIPNRNIKSRPQNDKIRTTSDKKKCEWWNAECEQAIKDRKAAYNTYRRTKNNDNWNNYTQTRNKTNKIIAKSKKSSWRTFCQSLNERSTTKEVWSKLGSLSGNKKSTGDKIPELKIPQKAVTDEEKANALANHYHRISSNEALGEDENRRRRRMNTEERMDQPPPTNQQRGQEINTPITEEEIKTAIHKKSNTAAGHDILNYRVLKELPATGIKMIQTLFQQIMEQGKVPQEWKHATIIPIPKPDKPKDDAASFRPISLTSHLGKILETIINDRIKHYLETNNLFSPTQSGFREGKCSIDQVIRLIHETKDAKHKKGEMTLAIFLDLEKAYDVCWRDAILHKSKQLGLDGKVFNYIADFLKDRTFKVEVDGALSETKIQENGIPQGSVISPTLFLILVNDLIDVINHNKASLSQFADDSALWSSAKATRSLTNNMQAELNKVAQWMNKWGLRINVGKTVGILLCARKKHHQELERIELKLNNQKIKIVDKTRFLGMIIDNKLNWSSHIDALIKKCTAAINAMNYAKGKGWGASPKTLSIYYKYFVRAKLDYGAILYNTASKTDLQRLNRIQNRALVAITKGLKGSSIPAMEVMCGIPPLELRRHQLHLNYWAKVQQDPEHTNKPAYNDTLADKKSRKTFRETDFPNSWHLVRELHKTPIPNLDMGNIALKHQPETPPWELKTPDTDLTLQHTTNKKDSPGEAKVKAEKLIDSRPKTALAIYTDGSKDEEGKVGCGIYIPEKDREESFSVTPNTSIYTAEMAAIEKALEIASEYQPKEVNIYTDSLSALQSLKQTNSKCSRKDIRYNIHKLTTQLYERDCKVLITWIPSHVDIHGNEVADELANRGRNTENKINTRLGTNEIKSAIKTHLAEKWRVLWAASKSGSTMRELAPVPSLKPRYDNQNNNNPHQKLLNRIRLGRIRYQIDNPKCDHCKCKNNIQHLLIDCPEQTEVVEPLKEACRADSKAYTLNNIIGYNRTENIAKIVRRFLWEMKDEI